MDDIVERVNEVADQIDREGMVLRASRVREAAAEIEWLRLAFAAERERCAAKIEQLKDELHAAKAALGAEGRANLERYMAARRAAIRKGERLIWTEDGCYGCNPVCDGCDGCGTRLRPGYRWSIG